MISKPPNASTPRVVPQVVCRRPISQRAEHYSPITASDMSNFKKFSTDVDTKTLRKKEPSPEISDDDSCNEETSASHSSNIGDEDKINNSWMTQEKADASTKKYYNTSQSTDVDKENEDTKKYVSMLSIVSVIISVVFVGGFYSLIGSTPSVTTIESMKNSFPQQNKNFWMHIKTSVSEIENFEKPSVIILMYKSIKSDITNELVDSISRYASCVVNRECSIKPILLNGKDLNTEETTKDYGIIIHRYKALLEEKHIMVVKNIEEISGTVAQAFHTFCDEYTPLVKKSLFIFTIQVNEYYGKEIEQVIDILQSEWSEIGHDKLEPLITRVSSIVLRVN